MILTTLTTLKTLITITTKITLDTQITTKSPKPSNYYNSIYNLNNPITVMIIATLIIVMALSSPINFITLIT
jgi:hypothetical protein